MQDNFCGCVWGWGGAHRACVMFLERKNIILQSFFTIIIIYMQNKGFDPEIEIFVHTYPIVM